MEVRIATPAEVEKLSKLSVSLGNVAFSKDRSIVALMEHETGKDKKELFGFAAVDVALHAAGSWVHDKHRRQGYSYQLRTCLDNELRKRGVHVYFALPANDFEKHLFQKYGAVTEQPVQIRHL